MVKLRLKDLKLLQALKDISVYDIIKEMYRNNMKKECIVGEIVWK
jgi:hypothetical protein